MDMGSPGCEHIGYTTHSPVYISHPHADSRKAWMDELEDIKPPRGLLGLPELSWSGVYVPCYDRLPIEENPWVLRMTEAPGPMGPPCRTAELSPATSSPVQVSPTAELEGQVEERCLEQIRSMVVGEVLKDVDTACKLLNITPGRTVYDR